MNTQLLFVGVPYAAMLVFLAGLIWRYRTRTTISARSSQLLESRWLVWGAVPFHLGMGILILGHVLPLVAAGPWQSLVSRRAVLLTVEAIGAAGAMLCLIGLIVLFVRRIVTRAVLASSTIADLLVLAVLIAQVTLGLEVAITHRWGALWSVRTTTPYLWSVFTLRPDPAFVAGAPLVLTLHILGGWITLALIPFTRLMHMLAVPLGYLVRARQRVVWSIPGRSRGASVTR